MLRKLKCISENRPRFSSGDPQSGLPPSPSSSLAGLLFLVAERMISPPTTLSKTVIDNPADTPAAQASSATPAMAAAQALASLRSEQDRLGEEQSEQEQKRLSLWQGLGIGAFLVSGPVFLEAPLVRAWPVVALAMTLGWLGLAWWCDRPSQREGWGQTWGDILFGFSLSWFAGAIYWGWFRWEPALHLPLESVGVPIVLACLFVGRGRLGSWFYLGSLLGTAITDAYLWAVDLTPYWKQVMQVKPDAIPPILAAALAQMNTFPGLMWAIACASALLLAGGMALRSRQVAQWIFAGAVLNTLAVDGLFWLTAMLGKM